MLPLTVLLSLVAVTSAGNYSLPKEFDIGKVELGTRCMSALLTLLCIYILHILIFVIVSFLVYCRAELVPKDLRWSCR